jgi:hypothetical protein
MAFQKFKPEVWSAKFMEDLDKTLVFKEDCNHTYEGDAKKPGDAVRIFGLGDVEIGAWHHGKLEQLSTAQEVTGHSILMPINEIRTFNFEVSDDLDRAQAMGGSGLMGKFTTKAKDNVADVIDQFIAGLHVGNCELANPSGAVQISAAGGSGATAILDAIDEAYLKLLENNVSRNTKVTLTAPPWFIMMLKRAYVELDTDNSAMLANGRVGRYGGITLKESNNVYHATESSHDVYHIQLKTDEAIAFVNPYTHMEGYRPDLTFIDCVKGYTLFDGMVVAPKQVIDLNVYK